VTAYTSYLTAGSSICEIIIVEACFKLYGAGWLSHFVCGLDVGRIDPFLGADLTPTGLDLYMAHGPAQNGPMAQR
jgi:hypothetical protein